MWYWCVEVTSNDVRYHLVYSKIYWKQPAINIITADQKTSYVFKFITFSVKLYVKSRIIEMVKYEKVE